MKQYLPTNKSIHLIGLILLGFIGYQFSVSTLLFFVNITISKANCWAILLSYLTVSSWYLYYSYKTSITKKEFIVLYGWSALIAAFSLLWSSYFIDYSYDGQSYHGEAIIQLANGWNPTRNYLPSDDIITLVINHFAKGSWVNGAFFYKLTGIFECAKSANLILIFATFFVAYPFFIKKFSKITTTILACLIAFNPICLNMYLSNMLDGQIASLTFLFFILLYNIVHEKETKLLPFLYLLIFYILNLKFTVVGYFGVFGFALIFYFLLKKQFQKQFQFIVHYGIACLLALFLFGFNAYTKNIITHQHPFYPFKGTGSSITDSTIVEAKDYKTGNKAVNFIKSNFAATTFSDGYVNPIKYKIPFTFSKYELERFAFAGVMIGGFGVWYSAVVLLSFFIFCYIAFKQRKQILKSDFIFYFLIVIIFVTILINPLGYIARYIPQYFIIPFLALLLFKKYYPFNLICKLLVFVLAVNALLICGYTFYNFVVTNKVKGQVAQIKKTNKTLLVKFGLHTAKRQLLEANKIPYKMVTNFTPNEQVDTLFRSDVVYKFE
jgi:hypothetical protein